MEKLLDQALLGLLLAGLLKKKPLAFSLRRTQLSGALFQTKEMTHFFNYSIIIY